ncbi:hypothetical protein [Clostridium botulinum]|uniref:hypothetical protein n=1 Tax=Clostridium botulinum TaxID=1491 RepID=UPI001E4B1095|nr:hypothetical protein [Clostridium botulinum]MCC5439661.1 hypothetical protein [Clostridium botulinum]
MSNTKSPWIYSEIAITKLIRNRKLSEYRKEEITKSINEAKQLTIKYDIDLNHLVLLDDLDLENWYKSYCNEEHPLDKLYQNKSLIKQVLHG